MGTRTMSHLFTQEHRAQNNQIVTIWDTNSKYRGLSGTPQRSTGETYSGRVQMNIRDNIQETPVVWAFLWDGLTSI